MTQDHSLLAHLSRRLTDREEDIAVEALGHILSKSEASRRALLFILKVCGVNPGRISRVEIQSTGDGGERPDLACFDEQGTERVLIEAKFWAGLTENQPIAYLRRLPGGGTSALLLVAPGPRLQTLWAELRRRIVNAEEEDIGDGQSDFGVRFATTQGERYLMLTSWRNLLNRMSESASLAGEFQRVNDIQQLQSLADQEDTNAFLPLRPEQLSPEFPRLLPHLYRLVDDTIGRLNQGGLASTAGYTISSARYYSIQYMTFSGVVNSSLGIYYGAWRTRPLTPIWLSMPIRNLVDSKIPFSLRQGDWRGHQSGNHLYVPVYLKRGAEYESVLDSMIEQLEYLAAMVQRESSC